LSDSTLIEQQAQRIQALETELARLRQLAAADLQSAQNDVAAKNRQIGQLKKELADYRDEQPESGPVKELLILWKTQCGKGAKTYIGLDGKRAKVAAAAIRKWGQNRCEQAIIGLSLKPYAGPKGRSATEYPGSKRYDDIEHALGDETRLEALEAVAKLYERPTLLDEPVGPAPAPKPEPEPERAAAADPPPGLLRLARAKRQDWRDSRPPITKVLASLHELGCRVVPGRADSWVAQCPAHEDGSPSLSILRKPDGMLLVHCFAGCGVDEVMGALGLELRDLWDGSESDYGRSDGPAQRVIPGHLRHAMRDLLARDERQAA
jgi:hypothetical protein